MRPPSFQAQMRLFLAPFLIGMAVLVVLPALATLVLAFTRYNALQPPVWIGLQNFSKLLATRELSRGRGKIPVRSKITGEKPSNIRHHKTGIGVVELGKESAARLSKLEH